MSEEDLSSAGALLAEVTGEFTIAVSGNGRGIRVQHTERCLASRTWVFPAPGSEVVEHMLTHYSICRPR